MASGKASAKAAAKAEKGPRGALRAGGTLLVVGLAMVGIDASEAGTAVTLIGLLVLIYGIHTFGRLGPEGETPSG
jgi:hypothetical protein